MTATKTEGSLYIGTFTSNKSAGTKEDVIFTYDLSMKSDDSLELKQSITLSGPINLSHVLLSNNGKFLFATVDSEDVDESRIHAWSLLDDKLAKLESPKFLGSWPITSSGACQMVMDKLDRFVYVACNGGAFAAFKLVDAGGELVRSSLFKFYPPDEVTVPEKQESSHITGIMVSPNDDYIYVSDLGNDCIWKLNYSRLAGFEFITELPYPCPAPPGSGPSRGVVAKREDGVFLYIGCELSNHLLVYWIDPDLFGLLEQCQYLPVLPEQEIAEHDPTKGGVTDVQLSSDTQLLFVASAFKTSISVFTIDKDGNANFIQWVETGGSVPRSLAVISQSNVILVANQESSDLTAFKYDKDGKLSQITINGENKQALPAPPTSLKTQLAHE